MQKPLATSTELILHSSSTPTAAAAFEAPAVEAARYRAQSALGFLLGTSPHAPVASLLPTGPGRGDGVLSWFIAATSASIYSISTIKTNNQGLNCLLSQQAVARDSTTALSYVPADFYFLSQHAFLFCFILPTHRISETSQSQKKLAGRWTSLFLYAQGSSRRARTENFSPALPFYFSHLAAAPCDPPTALPPPRARKSNATPQKQLAAA